MLDRMFRSMRSFWPGFAEATRGGSRLELPGLEAAFVPAMPDRSVVNCVVYEDAGALVASLDRLAAAYDEAGVLAWTVWVHESDERARAALEASGHTLDGEPMGQELDLAGVAMPAGPELDLVAEPSPADFDPIVTAAYGWPGFAAAVPAFPPGLHAYAARGNCGDPAACLGIWDVDGDAHVQLVATMPEARGRGLASRLLARALLDARERGCTTSSLQATAMGQPVYTRLGYSDLGRVQMWERRKPAPTP
jgi:GNAT superfamily N-acetyltransferase